MISITLTIVREGNLSAEGAFALDILAISCHASPRLLRGIPKPTAALTLARSGTWSDAVKKPGQKRTDVNQGSKLPSQVCRVVSLLETKLL